MSINEFKHYWFRREAGFEIIVNRKPAVLAQCLNTVFSAVQRAPNSEWDIEARRVSACLDKPVNTIATW